MVPGRSQFIALQSQNRQDEAVNGAEVEGLISNLRELRGLGSESRNLTAAAGHKEESGTGGI